jgi:5-hydroxyisourate hydrolase
MGISTHILDITLGRPAAGVPVTLAVISNGAWSLINDAVTDADGRYKHLLPPSHPLLPGTYRIHFETGVYYKLNRLNGLYPYVEIVFVVLDGNQHYHIPLLLTANSYTTYRGS